MSRGFSFLNLTLIVALAAAPAFGGEVRHRNRSPQSTDQNEVLRQSLLNVAKNTQVHRHLLGGAFLGGAALFSGTYIAQQRLRTGEPRRLAQGVIGVSLGLSLVGGLGILLTRSEVETSAELFARTPSRNNPEGYLISGEALLVRLANRQKVVRTYLGGGLMAMGLADLAWHVAEGSTPNTSFLVYKGAFFATLGLAFVLFPWPAEMEWQAYRENAKPDAVTVQVFPSGAGLGLALRF